MIKYNIKYIDFALIDATPIGSGTTAKCFKTTDNRVFKIYKKNNLAKEIASKSLLNKNFENFTHMSNYTFITANGLILDKNDKKVVGYVYPYVEGQVFSSINPKTRLLDVFKNYKQVLSDINKISDKKLQLADIHYGNIIYDSNGYFHIIDLDNCNYADNLSNSSLRLYNDKIVLESVISSLFKKNNNTGIIFKNENINKAYQDSLYYSNEEGLNKFIDEVRFYCDEANPTISRVRDYVKVKTNKSNKKI